MQHIRILLVLWQSFKDDVVLIELRVHRIDLALAQSVVQSIVDGRRRNTGVPTYCLTKETEEKKK